MTLGGANRKKNALVTATALPTLVLSLLHCLRLFTPLNSLIFAIVFLLNFFLLIAGSSGAVPFGKEVSLVPSKFLTLTGMLGTMLTIIVLWFGISAPLSAVGSFFGSKHGVCIILFLFLFYFSYISLIGFLESGSSKCNPTPNSARSQISTTMGEITSALIDLI